MDEQRFLVFLPDKKRGGRRDRTVDIRDCAIRAGKAHVTFMDGKTFSYDARNVDLRQCEPEPIGPHDRVTVKGEVWNNAAAITRFGGHTRITYTLRDGSSSTTLRESGEVEVHSGVSDEGSLNAVLSYWRQLAASLPGDDPTRKSVERLDFVDTESALARYMGAEPIEPFPEPIPAIYPFSSNISQRAAVDMALSHPLSVIEGPPGTGKTQTILNIVASVVAAGDKTVAVVSSTNSAVNNVREKLDAKGVGYVCAALGKAGNRDAFIAGQEARNTLLEAAMAQTPISGPPADADMRHLTERLREAQELDRDRARLTMTIGAYELEHRHFTTEMQEHGLPDLAGLPLLRRSSSRILAYLAESSLDQGRPGLTTRVRRYFRYR